VRALGRC